MRLVDLTGQRFGRLVVEERVHVENCKAVCWKCKCDCGETTVVRGCNLKSGSTRSCGCWERENRSALGTRSIVKHRESGSRMYRIWLGMKTRCYNAKDDHYRDYGERGIVVCNEWKHSYETFKEWATSHGYDLNLTIDRIDPNGNYCPENCRWITKEEQQRNKRNNRYITYKGITQLIPAWAEFFGVTDSTIRSRVRRGETPEAVLNAMEIETERLVGA